MKTIRNILCAVDIYDYQPALISAARELAAVLGATVTPVYVVAPLTEYVEHTEPQDIVAGIAASRMQGARRDFDAFLREHFPEDGARGVLLSGRPAEEILKYAEKSRPGMIVTATHGRRGVERMLYGSVADRIIRYAAAPVLTVNMAGQRGTEAPAS